MVSRKNVLSRFAFTMIELIFAIVIIGITVISLPMMTQITQRGIESSIVQEAIFAASAELMGATSYYWDLNSMSDANLSRLERVIDVGGTCENNASSTRYRLRPGHINELYHRRCLENSAIGLADTPDATFPNLNNFTDDTLFENELAAGLRKTGYKRSYNSAVTIEKLDGTGTANNNIKKITVTITDSGTTLTRLRTYCANIGEIDFYKRRF